MSIAVCTRLRMDDGSVVVVRRAVSVAGHRGDWQQQRRPRRLGEVEVLHQVTQDSDVLTDRRSPVGSAIGRGIQALTLDKHVLDELEVGIEAQRLMIDESLLCVWANYQCWHAQSIAIFV